MKHNKINKRFFTLLTWFLLQAAGTFAFAESIEPANGSRRSKSKQPTQKPPTNKPTNAQTPTSKLPIRRIWKRHTTRRLLDMSNF